MCVCVCVHTMSSQKPEDHVGSPGARAIGICEPPDVSAGKQIQVLRKCSEHFLSHLSSPRRESLKGKTGVECLISQRWIGVEAGGMP